MKMSIEEFTNYIIESAKRLGYELTRKDVVKNNGKILWGVSMISDNIAVPVFYLNQWYESYLATDGEEVLEPIMKELLCLINTHANDLDFDLSFIYDFEKAKDKIYMRIVNAQANCERLVDVPNRRILDLAIEYYLNLRLDDENYGCISISNSLLERFQVSEEDLHQVALTNMRRDDFTSFVHMSEVIRNLCGEEVLGNSEDECIPMYVLGNGNRLSYGAARILLPEVCEYIAEKMQGESYYVLPSSVHELIIVPESQVISVAELSFIVESVNNDCLNPEEILSFSVYRYDVTKKELCIAS